MEGLSPHSPLPPNSEYRFTRTRDLAVKCIRNKILATVVIAFLVSLAFHRVEVHTDHRLARTDHSLMVQHKIFVCALDRITETSLSATDLLKECGNLVRK
jgi:hypothetical protein